MGPGTPRWQQRETSSFAAVGGGVPIAAKRPQNSPHPAAGNERLRDGRRRSEKRKAAGLGTEIGWEIEGAPT